MGKHGNMRQQLQKTGETSMQTAGLQVRFHAAASVRKMDPGLFNPELNDSAHIFCTVTLRDVMHNDYAHGYNIEITLLTEI